GRREIQHPDTDDVRDYEHGERHGDDRAHARHHDQYRFPAETVRDRAREGRDGERRRPTYERDGPDLKRRMRELEDQPALRNELHPLPEHRADVAEPEHAEVRVLRERFERARAEATRP